MPSPTTLQGDTVVTGNFSAKTITLPAGGVSDQNIAAGAPNRFVSASKLEHQSAKHFSQGSATVASSATQSLHSVYGATATLLAFSVGCIVAPVGAATVSFDLKVAGVSLLSAPVVLNSSSVSRTPQFATVATPGLTQNQLVEIVVTATAGGGTLPSGIYADVVLTEDPF